MKSPRRFVLGGMVVMLAAGLGVGSQTGRFSLEPVEDAEGANRFTFRAATPPPSFVDTPHGTDIRLRDFPARSRHAGTPDLPFRIVRVAIPYGAQPRLAFETSGETFYSIRRPSAVPRLIDDRIETGDGERRPDAPGRSRRPIHRQDDRLYGVASLQPPVRLGEIGELREQRYVEVILSPLRWDEGASGLRVTRDLTVTVHFDGAGAAPPARDLADDGFEAVYRSAFVNYGQGRSFRRSLADVADLEVPGETVSSFASTSTIQAGPLYRILVNAEGLTRLDEPRMNGTGFLAEPISSWKLTSEGFEVPLQVFDGNFNDMLDAGDWVQFWAQRLDNEPKTALNTDIGGAIDLWEVRDFTDTRTYFLSAEVGSRSRISTRASAPTGSFATPADFEDVAHAEFDDAFRPLGEIDPWFWGPTQSIPPAGSLVALRTELIDLPGLASSTDAARVVVRLRGLSEELATTPDHKSRVLLKTGGGSTLEIDNDDNTFNGRAIFTHDFTWTWPGSGQGMTDPARIDIEALTVPGAPGSYKNQLITDYVEIHYRRLFQAEGDALVFTWPDEDVQFSISNVQSASPAVYEITATVGGSDVIEPVELTGASIAGGGPFTVTFEVGNDPGLADGTPRTFVVAGSGATTVPANPDFLPDTVSDLGDGSNQADLIVVAHPDVLNDAGGSALDMLLAYRLTQGISSKIARLDDIEDEFNDGHPGPLAIKNFLTYAMNNWQDPKPEYVLLLGDGSYDYKAGTGNGNFTPTQILFKDDPSLGYYASDNVLAAVLGGDQLPDLKIGRLSGRTSGEVDDVLQKLLDYETQPSAGPWQGHSVFVSDRGKGFDVFEASEFERINDIGVTQLPQPHTSRKMYYWSGADYCNGSSGSCDPLAIRIDIKDELNGFGTPGIDGAAMMQFVGHGNFDLWSDDVMFCGVDGTGNCPLDDTLDLDNDLELPWLIVHNCLTGGFHTPAAKSFGESWQKRVGGGGIAVFAPSGLGFRFLGEPVTERIWGDVYGGEKLRELGTVTLNSLTMLCGQNSTEGCQYYTLLGDPATQLRIPAPAPPAGVTATPGDGVVDLDWTASGEVTGHHVYRSGVSFGVFQRVTGTPVSCTLGSPCSFADTTVINASTYYYYVVGVDIDGFESRQSNFNADCDLGPDCVAATPLNPGPPGAPNGLTLTDLENGGRLEVNWNANSESDLDFYTVLYGTSPGVHTQSQNAGRNNTLQLSGLTNGTRYYVTVTATNTSGNTSVKSNEADEVPTLILGTRPPNFISDLTLQKSGNDLVLSWGDVTTDIYGKTETVDHYEVYRGTSPNFAPTVGNRIDDDLNPPTTPTFTDVGALTDPQAEFFYLVRAVDADDNGSGLGNQVPAGILDLTMQKIGDCSITLAQSCSADNECPQDESCVLAGDLLLSWTPIVTDFDGGPVIVDRYDLYAADQPFSRIDIRDNMVPMLTTTPATSVRITPPGPDQHYSVICVDARGNESPF